MVIMEKKITRKSQVLKQVWGEEGGAKYRLEKFT